MIDSHCHIAGPEFADDLEAVVQRARDAGVVQALAILAADDSEELARANTVRAHWPSVRFSIGVHPHAAGKFAANPGDAARTVEAALDAQPLARALGEIGLDYHYDFAPRDAQQSVFREQIRAARRRRLPIVIHTREAEDDTFSLLDAEGASEVGGVFHCFTGDAAMARRAVDAGFHVSFSGIVTFPRATAIHEAATDVPLDRLLIETDSPFLSPVPHRGGRNEPARVARVADCVARLRGIPVAEVHTASTANFYRLFNP
jgi:TatD DNase family protein